jgi:hypothetical protein
VFGDEPPSHKLFEHSTLDGMAVMLEHRQMEPAQEIDWERKAEIPSSFAETETIRTFPSSAATPPRTTESASWNGDFDFISVHSAAATILQAVRAKYAGADVAAITYSYQAGEMVYLLQLVRELTDGGTGLPVKSVPMGKWVEKAEQRGFNSMLAACLRSVTEGGILLAFPRLVQAGHK